MEVKLKNIRKKAIVLTVMSGLVLVITRLFIIMGGKFSNRKEEAIAVFFVSIPILLAIFHWGLVFKYKNKLRIYKFLTFYSIGLFLFSLIQIILIVFGIYDLGR